MWKINVAELLKGCPSGMELDCTMYENLYFDSLNADYYGTINCYTLIDGIKTSINFTKYGTFNNHIGAKCVIFPKGKTTWEGFQIPFKDGDIVATDLGSVFILKSCLEDKIHYHSYIGVTCCNEIQEKQIPFAYKDVCHLATEEEKEKLFKVIKDNGYKWNAETKTLEKLIEPKFKVGDKVRHKDDKTVITITGIKDDYYFIQFYNIRRSDYQNEKVSFKDQDKYELVPNDFNNKTLEKLIEPKFNVGDRIRRKNSNEEYTIISISDYTYYYRLNEHCTGSLGIKLQDDYELVHDKFDINTLVPFESRVLVRNDEKQFWMPAFWGCYSKGYVRSFVVTGGNTFEQCIPYEGNEHLLGKTDNCDEYFKTWKN